jgi:RNA polymerase sigma-70 factor (ECF subfamily)
VEEAGKSPELTRSLLENRRAIFGFVFALTRDLETAEEIFQEVSLAILGEASRGTRPENFVAWTRELARHRVADFYRARGRAPLPLSPSMVDAVAQAFDEGDLAPETMQARQKSLLECLAELPARARELIERRYRDRRSPGEIAEAVGWKLNAVHVGLSKARRALADCVEARLRPEGGDA